MWGSLSPCSCANISGVACFLGAKFCFPSLSTEMSPRRSSSHWGRAELTADLLSRLSGSEGSDRHLCSPLVVAPWRWWKSGQPVSSPVMEVCGMGRNRAHPSGEWDPHLPSALVPWDVPLLSGAPAWPLRAVAAACHPGELPWRVPSALSALCQSCSGKRC